MSAWANTDMDFNNPNQKERAVSHKPLSQELNFPQHKIPYYDLYLEWQSRGFLFKAII